MEEKFDKFVEKLQEQVLEETRRVYSEEVIDHWMHPRNWGLLNDANGYGKVKGTCGDTMEISLEVRNGEITRCGFTTDGCGTAIACGSMTTELILDKSIGEADSVTEETILQAFGGLPERDRHCATLSADALHQAIKEYEQKRMV